MHDNATDNPTQIALLSNLGCEILLNKNIIRSSEIVLANESIIIKVYTQDTSEHKHVV